MRRASQSLDVLAKLVPTRTEIEATEIKVDRLPSAQLTADLERAQLRTSTLQAPKHEQHFLWMPNSRSRRVSLHLADPNRAPARPTHPSAL